MAEIYTVSMDLEAEVVEAKAEFREVAVALGQIVDEAGFEAAVIDMDRNKIWDSREGGFIDEDE